MAVTKRTRYEVLKRDNHTCRYCRATDSPLTIDHVTPLALGGTDDPSNLVAACRDCNAGKSSTSPDAPAVADVKAIDMQWSAAMKRAADLLATQRKLESTYVGACEDGWTDALGRLPYGFDSDSVVRLYRAGLPVMEMYDAVGIAAFQRGVGDRFAYFMGICWKRLSLMQDMAKEILEADGAGA